MVSKKKISQKIDEAQKILSELGMPALQQNEISALTLLALCDIKPNDFWRDARQNNLTISKGLMGFVAQEYKREYAPNTRETFRRQVLHHFVQAHIASYNPDNPALPTNSPHAHYGLTDESFALIKTFGTKSWSRELAKFLKKKGSLAERHRKERIKNLVPITLDDGTQLKLSPGKHNEVQVAIVQEFAPRFAEGSKLLYLGDTAKKSFHIDKKTLSKINIPITNHEKLPDVLLYHKKKNWLFLIEAVTSHGPISPKRVIELEEMLEKCEVGRIYITAFPDLAEFKKHAPEIAWETEVWLVDIPDHMIHFNGDRFVGPR